MIGAFTGSIRVKHVLKLELLNVPLSFEWVHIGIDRVERLLSAMDPEFLV